MVKADIEARWDLGRAAWSACAVSLASFEAWLALHPEATPAYSADHYLV